MGQWLNFNSSFNVRKGVTGDQIIAEIKKRFEPYKDRFNHFPVITSSHSMPLSVIMGYDEKISCSGVDEIAKVWEQFAKEYADFSQGPVVCNRDTDGGELDWLVGPGNVCASTEEKNLNLHIENLQSQLEALKSSALYKKNAVVTTREKQDGETV